MGDLRHQIVRVLGLDPLNQFTFIGVVGNNRIGTIRAFFEGRVREVKAQTSLSHFGIRAVTTETATCENRLHILVEVHLPNRCTTTADKNAEGKGHQN